MAISPLPASLNQTGAQPEEAIVIIVVAVATTLLVSIAKLAAFASLLEFEIDLRDFLSLRHRRRCKRGSGRRGRLIQALAGTEVLVASLVLHMTIARSPGPASTDQSGHQPEKTIILVVVTVATTLLISITKSLAFAPFLNLEGKLRDFDSLRLRRWWKCWSWWSWWLVQAHARTNVCVLNGRHLRGFGLEQREGR
jgi:hypothetical protein